MTPREIAAALDRSPIAGLTHGLRFTPESPADDDTGDPHLSLVVGLADAVVYVNYDDLSGVFCVAGRLRTKEFWVRPETLRADLVEILAWSLNACHPDPTAPETLAALRTPGLYGEVLRKFLEDRPLVAALSAALKETS